MFAQIVTFTLKSGHSRDAFIKLTEEMARWLESQKGFVAYELYEGAECWMDRIAWDNQACAEAGREKFLASELSQKLLPFIESGHRGFFGRAVVSLQPQVEQGRNEPSQS